MPGHDIIVIGTSAGGLEALRTIVGGLPAGFPAAVFIVQHVSPQGSLLPEILSASGGLPASHPTDGTLIELGQIYVAPPDHHMLVERGHLHIVRGPKENGFRPAIDATFRTAARAFDGRVVGIILTGMLDDGTVGLLTVKRYGGTTLVQDPLEAAYPSMPESACRYVRVDRVVRVAEIAPLLIQLLDEPHHQEGAPPMLEHDRTDLEARISSMDPEALQQADSFGPPSPYTCPNCGGVLAEFYEGDLLRFRCQVGHAFSQESVLALQGEMLDQSLWAAFRSLDERTSLLRRLAREARRLNDTLGEQRFTRSLDQIEWQKGRVCEAMLKED